MALNLAPHKGTRADAGGSHTATTAEMNGIVDEDTATDVFEVAAEATCFITHNFGNQYEIGQVRIYADAVDTAYWTVDVSDDDASWTNKGVSAAGTYVYADVNGDWQYVRVKCDATGEAAIQWRETIIYADATYMSYKCGSSDAIGAQNYDASFTRYDNSTTMFIMDNDPAPADGYLVACRGIAWNTSGDSSVRVYIFRDAGANFECVAKWGPPSNGAFAGSPGFVLPIPLKFEAGDFIGCMLNVYASRCTHMSKASAGDSYKYDSSSPTDPAVGGTVAKADFATKSNYEFQFQQCDPIPLGVYPSTSYLPMPDRYLAGIPGNSTDPRVTNLDGDAGTNPELDFYPQTTSLDGDINDAVTTITVHKASLFPQGDATASFGGRIQIGSELIDYEYVSTNDFVSCTRGAGGTSPAAHDDWDLVRDMTHYYEISADDANFYEPGNANLPVSLGATIGAGADTTWYIRGNVPAGYKVGKYIYSRVSALWTRA